MTQPDPVEGTVDWFWGLACAMLEERGRFTEIISDKYEMSDPPPSYVPKRFIHEGEFNARHVAYHLYACGMASRDANTHFFDFAVNYRKHHPSVTEPAWTNVPAPVPHTPRPTLTQRRKKGGKPPPKTRTLAERMEGSNLLAGGTVDVPSYDEDPPVGNPTLDTEMSNAQDEPENSIMHVDRPSSSPMGPG